MDLPDPPTAVPPGWRSRGYLPHIERPALLQAVTWHVADSLPRMVLERMQRDLDGIPDSERATERRRRLHDLLDAGIGSCPLRGAVAAMVEGALLHHDGERYRLTCWTIMPNHVHALIEPLPGWDLPGIMHTWKSWTAHRYGEGQLWHREYWDRYIRDEGHWFSTVRYIDQNPVKAGLVQQAEGWEYGSARFGLR
jgi:putative transposase